MLDIVATGDRLGESPVWLGEALQRVDILGRAIVHVDPETGRERRRSMPGDVGFALPAADGTVIAGVERSLVRVGRSLEALAAVEPGREGNRFNDAACDACGRLWAGTLSRTRSPGAAALYRVVGDAPPERVLGDVTISNGLDWNLDATRMYYVDSVTQRIDAIDFDLDLGRLGTRRRFVEVAPGDGLPDGLCVDAEGGVWIALFGGGAIRRYTPTGELDRHIPLPVTNPTSLAFGGRELDELFVTSARHRLAPERLAREPLAGAVLRLRPGVTGRLPHTFGAS